jgi:flagellar basal body rod protein FlgG
MRTPGLDSAVAALRYWRQKNDMVANNLANVSSPGFKGQTAFAELLPGARPGIRAELDLSSGPLTETGAPLDIAIGGDGFLVVDTPAGERLSRRGALTQDDYGFLVDPSGNPVLGEGGPILLPPGEEIVIRDTGEILVDRTFVDRLRIERPEPGTTLTPEGELLFRPEGRTELVAFDDREVIQGFVEESNVNAVEGMIDLIDVQRGFVAVQRAVEVLDGSLATIANDIARPS